ncbi:MAG: helix-turn-helix transcriptional regulator [Alphaproteobacteria bacterium]
MKTKIPKNKIRELADERGISGRELAKMIGTSAPHMSRLEKGQTPLTIDWILKTAKALKVNTHEIIDLPLDRKFTGSCDDALLGSILGWLLEAADKHKVKLSPKDLSKWASYVYKEAVDQPLNFKETRYLASIVVRILSKK